MMSIENYGQIPELGRPKTSKCSRIGSRGRYSGGDTVSNMNGGYYEPDPSAKILGQNLGVTFYKPKGGLTGGYSRGRESVHRDPYMTGGGGGASENNHLPSLAGHKTNNNMVDFVLSNGEHEKRGSRHPTLDRILGAGFKVVNIENGKILEEFQNPRGAQKIPSGLPPPGTGSLNDFPSPGGKEPPPVAGGPTAVERMSNSGSISRENVTSKGQNSNGNNGNSANNNGNGNKNGAIKETDEDDIEHENSRPPSGGARQRSLVDESKVLSHRKGSARGRDANNVNNNVYNNGTNGVVNNAGNHAGLQNNGSFVENHEPDQVDYKISVRIRKDNVDVECKKISDEIKNLIRQPNKSQSPVPLHQERIPLQNPTSHYASMTNYFGSHGSQKNMYGSTPSGHQYLNNDLQSLLPSTKDSPVMGKKPGSRAGNNRNYPGKKTSNTNIIEPMMSNPYAIQEYEHPRYAVGRTSQLHQVTNTNFYRKENPDTRYMGGIDRGEPNFMTTMSKMDKNSYGTRYGTKFSTGMYPDEQDKMMATKRRDLRPISRQLTSAYAKNNAIVPKQPHRK